MALSDEIAKPSSERYYLVKVIPSLELNSFLTVKSGTIYQATLASGYEIDSVAVDAVIYSESTVVNPSSGEFYYDFDSGSFEINFGAAIGSKEAILNFILRFTDSEFGVFDDNGVKNAAVSYQWHCRIDSPPEIDTSVRDMISGITSISSSAIAINNTDLWFNSFMSGKFSYANKDIYLTYVINEVVAASFFGKTRGIYPSGDNIIIKIYDSLYYLSDVATMGDSNEDSFINLTTYSDPDPASVGFCIPYVNGKTPFKYVSFDDAGAVRRYEFDPLDTLQAYCTDTTTSRNWSCVRIATDSSLKVASYASPSSVTFTANFYSYGNATNNRAKIAVVIGSGTHNLELLDFVEFKKSGVYYPATVVQISDANAYNCLVWDSTATAGTYTVSDAPTSTMGVMIEQGSYRFYPAGGWDGVNTRDYRFIGTVLDSGNVRWDIEFRAGFESKHPGMATIDYKTTKIYIRVSEDSAQATHGNVCSRMLLASGLTVNSASITQADSDLNAKVNLCIPEISDKTPRNYGYYLGLLMSSTRGYVYQNNSTYEMHYKLFVAPSTGDVLFESQILNLLVNIATDDMAESVRAYNDGNYYAETDYISQPLPVVSASVSSTKSRYLHGLRNQNSMKSCLQYPETTANRQLALARNEQMTVTIEVATMFIDKNIGDDIAVADDRIPGAKTTVNGFSCSLLKIVGIKYSTESVILTCFDVKVD